MANSGCQQPQDSVPNQPIALAVHGGAGTILRENMTPELEAEYHAALRASLQAGYAVLERGGSSVDAVQAAIVILEDCPLFNAGKGAVFTNAGTNELDASIMEGRTLNAGAVAGVKTIKNPIVLARLVMERSPHVMLAGRGAEAFAQDHDIAFVSPEYFHTERRWQQLQEQKSKETEGHSAVDRDMEKRPPTSQGRESHFGTVGCVALDRQGHLAAGTSTGGLTNKRFGRVGDSPIIGAGTYANDRSCAVSCTGQGEYFMRSLVAYDISAMMTYGALPLDTAAERVVMEKLTDLGGQGGAIAIDRQGNIAMPFNTPGMYRGAIDREGRMRTALYGD